MVLHINKAYVYVENRVGLDYFLNISSSGWVQSILNIPNKKSI